MMHRWFVAAWAAFALASPAAGQQPAGTAPARDASGVYELAAVTVPPHAVNARSLVAELAANYPAALAQVAGEVRVSVVVSSDGFPQDERVVESSDSGFNAPSLAAVRGLRFTPGKVNGRAVPVRVEIPISWRPAASADSAPSAVPAPAAGPAGVEEQPRPLNTSVLPRELARLYPAHLRNEGVDGEVLVRFIVPPDGRPVAVEVVRSSNPEFNEPTLRAVRVLRFRPARLNGQPIPVTLEVPIQWFAHRR